MLQINANFPVDGLCGSFDTIYAGFSETVQNDPHTVQEDVFWRTAALVYGLELLE